MSAEEQAKLKNEQVRCGFVQAAKEIILRDGVDAVSVRKIAQATGYSYATIYHYFLDLNALLLAAKESMVGDVSAYLTQADPSPFRTVEDLKRVNRDYAQYYLDRPHVYHFFYAYRFENEPVPNYDLQFQDGWHFAYSTFVEDGLLRREDVVTAAKTIIYTMHGLLALYFSSNGLSTESFYQDLDTATDFIIGNRREL
ncbi:MAG: TetR/AcrR family transcriptional regulator [Eubacteriales bacterium]|jgi:AcrR family transcriptional regulator|nr:TetR/AcrR family transcriptional regulator [Eubacteriales bacterium]